MRDWYPAHGRAVANEYWARFYLEADSIRMNRSDGALVQLMMLNSETPDAAQARIMKLGSQFLPLLDRYILIPPAPSRDWISYGPSFAPEMRVIRAPLYATARGSTRP